MTLIQDPNFEEEKKEEIGSGLLGTSLLQSNKTKQDRQSGSRQNPQYFRELFEQGSEIDMTYYKEQIFRSVEVEELVLTDQK